MNTLLLALHIALWGIVLVLSFLLLGTLRAVALLRWRLAQLEARTPRRLGRNGLKPGRKAPDFTLPSVEGTEVALHDFAGRKVLLVFTQSGCQPCHRIVPELNRLQRKGAVQVLVVHNGDPKDIHQSAGEVQAGFLVLVQERWRLSRRYEVFATPFAFLIDAQGMIVSKGIINNGQHIRFVLAGAGAGEKVEHAETASAGTEANEMEDPFPISS
jgi:methylamine dehydrogenase accessory protein MauD